MYKNQNVRGFKLQNACPSIHRSFWAILDQSLKLKSTSIWCSKISKEKIVELWMASVGLGMLFMEQKLLNMIIGDLLKSSK